MIYRRILPPSLQGEDQTMNIPWKNHHFLVVKPSFLHQYCIKNNMYGKIICLNIYEYLGRLCIIFDTTVDGCEILHQLIDGKHPIIYFVRVSTILLVMQDFATIHIVTTYLPIAIAKLRSAGPAPTKRSGRSAVAASPRQISWLILIIYTHNIGT